MAPVGRADSRTVDQVQPCLNAYQALIAEFTDPDDSARADAAWDSLLLTGCLPV